MIPKNITQDHILRALSEVRRNGVPKSRRSTKFHVLYRGRRYPPKYVVSVANRFANGEELLASDFGGGKEANDFLARLGFTVVARSEKLGQIRGPRRARIGAKTNHNERCKKCKNTIIEMFRRLYGEVKVDYGIKVCVRAEDHTGREAHRPLCDVRDALQAHRGYRDFVKAEQLPPCDLYIPSIRTVVELDESQHFTMARKTALMRYPPDLPLGFSLAKWKSLCDSIDAKDTNPPYRDEQRAWYDTLRDFLPLISGMNPTVRIYMGDFQWCSLNPHASDDVQRFRAKLRRVLPRRGGPIRQGSPDRINVATVTIASKEDHTNHSRTNLMGEVVKRLAGAADVILFPAGFYTTKGRPSLEDFADCVRLMLSYRESRSVVCFGIDGRKGKDQIAVAVGPNGILAAGRKFWPTAQEKGSVELARDAMDGEAGYPRIFDIAGKKAYLAVCYDVFGIKKRDLKNPGVDLVLNLVHRFNPKGEGLSGDPLFAKHGFAGSSKQWSCPTFGAAVFFNRHIPRRWPTGVTWNQGSKNTRDWKYSDNPLKPIREFWCGCMKEKALVRILPTV